MQVSEQQVEQFQNEGCVLLHGCVSKTDINDLVAALEGANIGAGMRGHNLPLALQKKLGQIENCQDIANALLDSKARLVRMIVFNKTPAHNWSVPWHQDRTIAVSEKRRARGYVNWTRKGGIWHAEPPEQVLHNMVTLRLGLDDCGSEHGPLKIICGSHKQRREQEDIIKLTAEYEGEEIIYNSGDIFAMRPLLVHTSRSARRPTTRRVIHLEYAKACLDIPMLWKL